MGVKVTEMVQLSLAPNVFGNKGQFEVWAKSPEVEIPAIVRRLVWLFCTVATFAALVVPTIRLPNDNVAGDTPAAISPVPVNCAVWGELEASSVTIRAPVCTPTAVGVKVTEMEQASFGASVFGDTGQFEVWEKLPEVDI